MINKREYENFVNRHLAEGRVIHYYKNHRNVNEIVCCHETHEYLRMIWPETSEDDDLLDDIANAISSK